MVARRYALSNQKKAEDNSLNAPVENTLKLFDTYLFFILFRRFLFQFAHLLLDALQHRVRANGSLDYAFRRLGDASLNF